MSIDPNALKAAEAALSASCHPELGASYDLPAAIAAYLAAAPTAMQPEDGLVKYLASPPDGGNRYWGSVYSRKKASEAATIITSLRAENERLTKERDAALDNDWVAAPAYAAKVEQCQLYSARATTLQARLDAAVEALKPFAEAADDAERLVGHDGPLGQYIDLTHLRAARALAPHA